MGQVDTLSPELRGRLHGAVRSLRPSSREPADAETVVVNGVGAGSRGRLRPRKHGTDAHDMFLDGRTARLHEVLLDVDGSRFLAVTVDDDPGGADPVVRRRFLHFTPEEVEPPPDDAAPNPV